MRNGQGSMTDEEILSLYAARSERAVSETEKKYGRYFVTVARRIAGNDEDAKEIVNDAYLKLLNSIPPQEPSSLKGYAALIVRELALYLREKQTSQKRGGEYSAASEELDECFPDPSTGDYADEIALRDALNKFLYSLPKKERSVFVCRYFYAGTLDEIAAAHGMKKSGVSMMLKRTREKLKELLHKEGIE